MDYAPDQQPQSAYVQEIHQAFTKMENAAQYGGSDYMNAVRVEREITLEKAFEIAQNDPNIDYFFYTKGYMMVLLCPENVIFDSTNDPLNLVTNGPYRGDDGHFGHGTMRVFCHGDAVFFKKAGEWLGSAPGLADIYQKN